MYNFFILKFKAVKVMHTFWAWRSVDKTFTLTIKNKKLHFLKKWSFSRHIVLAIILFYLPAFFA